MMEYRTVWRCPSLSTARAEQNRRGIASGAATQGRNATSRTSE
jgi:hypothetical protein